MNIADEGAQIHVRLTKDRFVSPLKNVPDFAVFSIVILAVSGQHSKHYPPDRLRLPFDQQVEVVRHQAVCIEIKAELLLLDGEQRNKLPLIIV